LFSARKSRRHCSALSRAIMGIISSCLSCFQGPPAAARAPAAGADDDTVFASELLTTDGEALRSEAHALGDAASASGAASQAAYQGGDKARARELSQQAQAQRSAAAAKNAAAARAIFAQKNATRGHWEIDLHLLLVAEALERTKRRLQSCATAAASEGAAERELVVIYGQGHHSQGGVAKIKPAVLQLLADEGFTAQEGVPNAGACAACSARLREGSR
jgi:hypothetical protein